MQYSQKNFMRIIGNDQKNNGQNFWEILERIIGKIASIIGAGLSYIAAYTRFIGRFKGPVSIQWRSHSFKVGRAQS